MRGFIAGSFFGAMTLMVFGYPLEAKGALLFVAGGGLWLFAYQFTQYVLWRLERKRRNEFSIKG